ncbi:peptidyl-prolyl cis-trans isomerase [Limisphaera sp. VF-2]|uniref:peptidylprolyl isomerase n=1 Tax=Limisphaera sp. VF-2 TaxID=3400418 RepID=UPI001771C61C|nr:peptidyl-prolyl cis-trans isomerase [Limisphaera sp.]
MKSRAMVGGWLAACLVAISAGGAELVNGIRAVVHDSVITLEEVNRSVIPALGLLQRQYRNDPETFRQKLNQVVEENVEQLVQRQLILQDWQQSGYQLPEAIVEEAVNERLREQFGGDRVRMVKTLQAEGLTLERFRRQVREQIIVEILRNRNISREVIISPHKIEQYYRANQDKFRAEPEVKLRMIVLNKRSPEDAARVRQLAAEIRSRILEGADFAEMATVYSEGAQRAQGGDWGWVERSVLRKELADVAFALPPRTCSEVVDLPEACYLLWVDEARPERIRPLSELREEIERTLVVEERARLQKRYVDKLRAKTFVRYF